jgi:hypothetical protein
LTLFKTAAGEALAINVPAGQSRVLKHFQERMPMGCSCRTFGEDPRRKAVSATANRDRRGQLCGSFLTTGHPTSFFGRDGAFQGT